MGLFGDKETRRQAKAEAKARRAEAKALRKMARAEARAERAAARRAERSERKAQRKAERVEARMLKKAARKEAREKEKSEKKAAKSSRREGRLFSLAKVGRRKKAHSEGSFETWSDSEKRWYNNLSIEDFVFLHEVAEHGCLDEEDEDTLERLRRSWREETGK